MGNINSYFRSKSGNQRDIQTDSDNSLTESDICDTYSIRAKRKLVKDAPECSPYYDAIVNLVNSPDNFKMPTTITKLNAVLYLGNLEDAKDVTLLKEKYITYIITTVEDLSLIHI